MNVHYSLSYANRSVRVIPKIYDNQLVAWLFESNLVILVTVHRQYTIRPLNTGTRHVQRDGNWRAHRAARGPTSIGVAAPCRRRSGISQPSPCCDAPVRREAARSPRVHSPALSGSDAIPTRITPAAFSARPVPLRARPTQRHRMAATTMHGPASDALSAAGHTLQSAPARAATVGNQHNTDGVRCAVDVRDKALRLAPLRPPAIDASTFTSLPIPPTTHRSTP